MTKITTVQYTDSDWIERDNFSSLELAEAYATLMRRMYNRTPYRIVERDERFVVEFVPEWNLRAAVTVPCGWCDAPVAVASDHGQVVHCSAAHERLNGYVPVGAL